MLTFFAIPKAFEGATAVRQRNAVQSWLRGCPGCEVILCGDDAGVADAALAWGVRHVPQVRRNGYGTPLLNDAFERAAALAGGDVLVYVNCDILFVDRLDEVVRSLALRSYLLTGRRWSVEGLVEPIDFADSSWRRRLDGVVRERGRLDPSDALDYFVFPRRLSWKMPEFAVGRPGWDNWMIYQARVRGIPVVDATACMCALHPEHDYLHVADAYGDRWKGPEGDRNMALAGGPDTLFDLDDATHRLAGARIERVSRRRRLHRDLDILTKRYPRYKALWTSGHRLVSAIERMVAWRSIRFQVHPDSRVANSRRGNIARRRSCKPRYLVVKGMAGLGNRMGALCQAMVYARLTGRTLVVDWRDDRYSDGQANAFPLLFSSDAVTDNTAIRASVSVYPEIWRNHLDWPVVQMRRRFGPSIREPEWERTLLARYAADLSRLDYEEDVVVSTDYEFQYRYYELWRHGLPHDLSLGYEPLVSKLLRGSFEPVDEIMCRVSEFRQKWLSAPTVGVHIRCTDNMRTISKRTPVSSYVAAIDRLMDEHPQATLFLATDDARVEREYCSRYPNTVTFPKHYPADEEMALHDARSATDRMAIAREALIEMRLLAACTQMVYSGNSSFAVMAARMSGLSKDRLHDVYGWGG